jgi:type IV pilus assembly protein PilC
MKFNYQTRTKKGQIQTGTVEAASKEAALNLLQKRGVYVTFLESPTPSFLNKKIKIFNRISQKDIVLFSRQLSIMFKSRVSLIKSLQTLSSQTRNQDFRDKILKLSEQVEGGVSFSKALSHYPKLFSPFYVSIIKSGEVSGKLSEVLDYLADHLEREYHLMGKIRGAMIYPSLVLFVVFIILLVIFFFVIPQFTKILGEVGQDLPLITQIVVAISDFIRKWFLLLIVFLIGFVFLFKQYIKTAEGKRNLDNILLRLPIMGPFLKMFYLSRFAENLSTLISGGLPIAQALQISGEIVGSTVYQDIIFKTRDEVRKGEQISSVLQAYPGIFPPMFSQMVLVGEKTGSLDKTLLNVVGFYQKEIERTVNNIVDILEPILIVFLGVIVAGIMLSVLMPIYKMTGAF